MSKKLTQLVLDYRKTKNNLLMKEILQHTEKIAWRFLLSHSQQKLPLYVKRDLVEECNSIALSRALEKWDETRAGFSTYFYWELRRTTYLAAKYHNCVSRSAAVISMSDGLLFTEEDGWRCLRSRYSTTHNEIIKKFVRDIFKTKVPLTAIK